MSLAYKNVENDDVKTALNNTILNLTNIINNSLFNDKNEIVTDL